LGPAATSSSRAGHGADAPSFLVFPRLLLFLFLFWLPLVFFINILVFRVCFARVVLELPIRTFLVRCESPHPVEMAACAS
jgi:hypothetical protein